MFRQKKDDTKEDFSADKESKMDSKDKKKAKESTKNLGGKDTKLEKNKKDVKDKKGKSVMDEAPVEESFSPDFPEMIVFASFTDLPLNKLSASTEVVIKNEIFI